jgi:predicted HD superfamily hydrolase involved in NAD metabolism
VKGSASEDCPQESVHPHASPGRQSTDVSGPGRAEPALPKSLARLVRDVPLTGHVDLDVAALLTRHGYTNTVRHCRRVAAEAERLAAHFGAHPARAQTAGWLHDVSAVFPVTRRLAVARELDLDILSEEQMAPMLLHQKLSAAMARDLFGVQDKAVLSAVGCHTTLKANASLLDKVLFVADKVAWDQPGTPPYLGDVRRALKRSLDEAVFCYLEYLWQRRADLGAVHPWFMQAYLAFQNQGQAPPSEQKSE